MTARSALAAILLTQLVSTARADDERSIGLSVSDCVDEPLDTTELAARIALELALDPGAVALDSAAAPTQVRVEAPCGAERTTIRVIHRSREAVRDADLGGATGVARVWAVALLVAELVRALRERSPPPVAQAYDEERPYSTGERAARSPTRLGVGAAGRLYFEQLTLLGGAELSLAHEWLRVSLLVLGTDVPSDLGGIALGSALIEVSARPLVWSDDAVEIAAEVSVSGGVVYAAGHSERVGVRAADTLDVVAGASLTGRVSWILGDGLALELALGLGYDVLGPLLEGTDGPIAAMRGFRGCLSLGASFAP